MIGGDENRPMRTTKVTATKSRQSAANDLGTVVVEDHRVRVGRERREKMRAHLLASVLAVCSGEHREPAQIDDVVRHAEVSRGTFYKYFDSMDVAIAELALQLAEEMTDGILWIYDVLEDPVLRTATGFQMFLLRAIIEPEWGAFIAHIGLLSGDNLLTRKIRADIQLGIETGDYAVSSIELASDLLMGAKIEAIRRLISGGGTANYVRGMATLVLRSFGVSPAKAEKCVQRAYDRLAVEAPGKIIWWRAIA